MTISGLCIDIQTASGNRNCWSTSTSINQSSASCKIPLLLYFLDDILCCSPSLTKIIVLSLHSLPASHAQSPSILHYVEICISHFVMPFDNLVIYGQRLLFLSRRGHNQYYLKTPHELDSLVMLLY